MCFKPLPHDAPRTRITNLADPVAADPSPLECWLETEPLLPISCRAMAQRETSPAINVSLTLRNWVIGYYMLKYEQRGSDRADYGERLWLVPRRPPALTPAKSVGLRRRVAGARRWHYDLFWGPAVVSAAYIFRAYKFRKTLQSAAG